MKSTSVWTKDFQSVVDNGRNHSTVIDLPQQAGGSNNGPTALELCVMSFSGCIGTIFSLVAKKMRLEFDKMQVDVEAEKKDNAPTITDINCIVTIKSQEGEEKIKKMFRAHFKNLSRWANI